MLSWIGILAGGASAPRVKLVGDVLSDVSTSPTDSEVSYEISSVGTERSYEGIGGVYSTIGTWLLLGAAGDFDCRLTVDSGDNPTSGSALASWLNCGTTRSWTLTDTSVIGGALTNSCTIELRDATTFALLESKTVTMSAEEAA